MATTYGCLFSSAVCKSRPTLPPNVGCRSLLPLRYAPFNLRSDCHLTTLPPCLFLRDAAVPGLWALWVLVGAALAHSCHEKTGDPLECSFCGYFEYTPTDGPWQPASAQLFGYTYRQLLKALRVHLPTAMLGMLAR